MPEILHRPSTFLDWRPTDVVGGDQVWRATLPGEKLLGDRDREASSRGAVCDDPHNVDGGLMPVVNALRIGAGTSQPGHKSSTASWVSPF
jgi:hypothetical protein